ncbi:hypothetical protein GQ600_25617 [Phytophthora cactorum]|nr:hypothetical protein GQ600_25617 [Phytophthora cactorum]
MIKYVGQAVRILWRYRRQHHWNIGDEQDEASRSHQRLPVLSISCLKNMAVCSTILAELLVVRGVLCAVTASKSSVDAVDVDSWRFMTFHYVSWEITSVVIVLCMLHKTPIAVHCFSDTRSAKKSQQDSVTPSAPAIDSVVPGVRELVSDYVVPSNVSLLSAQRRRMEHENIMEPRYCRIHHKERLLSGSSTLTAVAIVKGTTVRSWATRTCRCSPRVRATYEMSVPCEGAISISKDTQSQQKNNRILSRELRVVFSRYLDT